MYSTLVWSVKFESCQTNFFPKYIFFCVQYKWNFNKFFLKKIQNGDFVSVCNFGCFWLCASPFCTIFWKSVCKNITFLVLYPYFNPRTWLNFTYSFKCKKCEKFSKIKQISDSLRCPNLQNVKYNLYIIKNS